MDAGETVNSPCKALCLPRSSLLSPWQWQKGKDKAWVTLGKNFSPPFPLKALNIAIFVYSKGKQVYSYA